MSDEWEQRVAAALELQQRPKRPVWRIVGAVVATMVVAYFILSMAFNDGPAAAPPLGERASIRSNTTFGLDPAARDNGAAVETLSDVETAEAAAADSARLFAIRSGVSEGVRRAYEAAPGRPVRTAVNPALSEVSQPAPRISETGEALDLPSSNRGAPPLPAVSRVDAGPASTSRTPDRTVSPDPQPTAAASEQDLAAFAATAEFDTAPPAAAANPTQRTVLSLDNPVLIYPLDGPAAQAPAGVWIAPPGVRVPVELTVSPAGLAQDVSPAPAAIAAGVNPLVLSAAVRVVEASLYPALQNSEAAYYRGLHIVEIPPSDSAAASIVSPAPFDATPGQTGPAAATSPAAQPFSPTPRPTAGQPQRRTAAAAPGEIVWLARPTAADFAAAFPLRALRNNIDGVVLLDCVVDEIGALRCDVQSERPRGYGFGDAALEIARNYVVQPTLSDGTSAVNERLEIPMQFQLQ